MKPQAKIVIGIESGATGTVAMMAGSGGKVLAKVLGAPLHPESLRNARHPFAGMLKSLGHAAGVPLTSVQRIVICMAGISLDGVQTALTEVCTSLGISSKPEFYPDIFSTLVNELDKDPGIVVVAGTGSCVLAHDGAGHVRRCGGWGSLLGDEGSAYGMGIAALKALLAVDDGMIAPGHSVLNASLQQHVGVDRGTRGVLNWSKKASKDKIAMLAPLVLAAARKNDALAEKIVQKAAEDLAEQIMPLVAWLEGLGKKSSRIILTGGLAENHHDFADLLRKTFTARLGPVPVAVAHGKKGEGALRLAIGTAKAPVWADSTNGKTAKSQPVLRATETAHPRSTGIDTLPSEKIIEIIQEEDLRVPQILVSQRKSLAGAVDWIADSIGRGGRVFYVGAGTSGRLAALDAAELGPTFNLPDGVFEVIMAGGEKALGDPVEGAEDDEKEAPARLAGKKLKRRDIVVGIAASGSTPFVLSAIRFAKKIGAKTIGIACNAGTPLASLCDLPIVAAVGPEIIGGSTRMKAGTATKLILNTLSTAAMIRMGKVMDHWMVEVAPTNKKLQARALGIVRGLTGCNDKRAEALLKNSRGNPKTAVLMGRKNISRDAAYARLRATEGNLRTALECKD